MEKQLTTTPIISVIVVSYNTCELTLEALESLFQQTSCLIEVIVIDNASNDGSAEAIKQKFPKVTLIASEENLGFAAGNNLGAQYATAPYLLLLNPDTIVLDGAVDKLLKFAEKYPEAKIWGGKTLFADYTLNPSSCWSRQTLWSLFGQAVGLNSLFRKITFFNPEGIGGWDRNGERYVDIVSGCFLMIERSLWNTLDGFHPDFFMYGEEADLCLRARYYNATPMVTSAATIIHYGGASEKVRSDKLVKLMEAKQRLIFRHFSQKSRRIANLLLSAWPLSRYIAHKILYLSGVEKSKEKCEVWKSVWKQRDAWFIE